MVSPPLTSSLLGVIQSSEPGQAAAGDPAHHHTSSNNNDNKEHFVKEEGTVDFTNSTQRLGGAGGVMQQFGFKGNDLLRPTPHPPLQHHLPPHPPQHYFAPANPTHTNQHLVQITSYPTARQHHSGAGGIIHTGTNTTASHHHPHYNYPQNATMFAHVPPQMTMNRYVD